jgi:Tol biopolymer transport system component
MDCRIKQQKKMKTIMKISAPNPNQEYSMSKHLNFIPLAILLILLAACRPANPSATPVLSEVENPAPTAPDTASEIHTETPTIVPTAIPENLHVSSTTLAFTSARDGNMEIYIMDTDGSAVHRLTDNPAEDYWPTWSPDGTQIAFASNRDGDFEIFVIDVADVLLNTDNSAPRQLTHANGNDLEPAWSPDGSKIAFMVHQANQSSIYTMNPDGSERALLTEGASSNYLPKWSPDGNQIVFVSERDGNPEIYIMNADGSAQTRLTDNPADDRYPAWSSQGDYISFYSDRDGKKELCRIDINGQNLRPLTNHNAAVWVSDWSPAGNQIALTSNRDGNREIYIMDTETGNLQRLTDNRVLDGIPAWRPVTAEPLPAPGTSDVARTRLTYTDLMDGFNTPFPLDEAALTLPADAAPPAHIFEGRLELHGEDIIGELQVLRGDPNQEPEVSHLPEFDFEFVQSADGFLIPVQRGLIIADHPYWNYLIEPGRVWQENGDNGYSRASFPFALVWKGSNAIFNGTMTFLFDDKSVSKAWYQITQETTVSTSMDLWGLLEGSYHPGPVRDADQIKADFAQELADRFPTKPIEQLAEDYPGVDVSAFGRGVASQSMTWYGFVTNGVNYVSSCQTRYGEYPYCEYLRAPSYSTIKSAFVGMAVMRLAQKYDPNVPNLLIKDYVPEAADSPGDWSAVTFDHVLDMSTGNYKSAGFMVDEEQWDNPFWNADYYDEIIAATFSWPHSADPGTHWVYRTSDTFILTRALQNYLVEREGSEADIFEFVVDEVYKPLKMGPGVFSVLRTKDNNWQGQPYGGVGMWWIPDDLAKIGNFMNADGGTINGEQILHPDMLAAALQHNPDDRGVDRGRGGKYNGSFWADPYEASYACEFWVPQMLGYSGIVVAFFPNGTTYYYASDGRDFTWDMALCEADKISPHCP